MDTKSVDLKQFLNEKGYRLTPQREAILNVIISNKGKHLCSEEIYEIVKEQHVGIGVATVYRALPLLEKMGFISTIYLDDGCVRYEFNSDEGQHNHHHLICVSCGEVEEVQDDLLESLEEQVRKNNRFIIKNHSVKFYGYCSKCNLTCNISSKSNVWKVKL
ncbi:MAG: transcriptional repressor [Clostridia bacterium]|nr:transcriptional repressor [Clostridia bacterium]